MSDFDREAERRRLEEKYEKDREKRKSTQRMSELLLKGATMTNQHCDECGAPIFRHNGQEFCPNCQAGGEGAAAGDAEAAASVVPDEGDGNSDGAAAGAGTPETDPESVRDVGPEAGATNADDAAESATEAETGASDATVRPSESADPADPSAADDPEHTAGSGAPRVERDERGRRGSPAGASTGGDAGRSNASTSASANANATTGAETAGGARESLLRALRAHADRAAAAEEPRRAREHLEAAREAAEALSALDGGR